MLFFEGKNCSCAICKNNIILNGYPTTKIVHTKCNHYFCYNCFAQWMKIKNNCPLCRVIFMKHIGFVLEDTIHK